MQKSVMSHIHPSFPVHAPLNLGELNRAGAIHVLLSLFARSQNTDCDINNIFAP